jgi:hypothetical protein
MSFYSNQVDKITGKIAALKSVTEITSKKYETTSLSSLYSSLPNVNTLMDAIMAIFKQLGGYDDMIKTIENILSKKLDEIETTIKSAIKKSLKATISCGVEPSIGDFLILTGVTFELSKVDPTSILTIDPTSTNGTYAYFDNLKGVNSRDFNVFLYTIINKTINNSEYGGAIWYKVDTNNGETVYTPLFKVSYNEYMTGETRSYSNVITIKLDETLRGQKLSYFISRYLDSVKLFNNVQVISSIFDEILGTNIISINKTAEQLVADAEIQTIAENIINNIEDDTYTVDDTYYTFSNDTYNKMLEDAENKKKGTFVYNSNTNTNLEVDQDALLSSLDGLKVDDLSISDQTKVLTSTINTATSGLTASSDVSSSYEFSLKTDLINSILKKLITTISETILSPKVIFLFSLTSRIFGLNDEDNATEFIKKNINVYKTIILAIRDTIMTEFTNKITELLSPMVSSMIMDVSKEKNAIYKSQLTNIKKLISKI